MNKDLYEALWEVWKASDKIKDMIVGSHVQRTDTERIDYLSKHMFVTESHHHRGISVGVDEGISPRSNLREAIDAAMQKEKE